MKHIAVVGGDSFLGLHVRWRLLLEKDVQAVSLDTDVLDEGDIASALQGADAVIYTGKATRTSDIGGVYEVNQGRLERLLSACASLERIPHLVLASSIHRTRGDEYGRSMKESEERVHAWSREHGTGAAVLVIPNEFGEWGAPRASSVVSTFADEIARGERSQVGDAVIPLVYVQDVAEQAVLAAFESRSGDVLFDAEMTSVADIYAFLKESYDSYAADIVPSLKTLTHVRLFNTLRSHLFLNGFYPRPFNPHTDERGTLFETIKTRTEGQAFFSTTRTGMRRGSHYHRRKIERFAVIGGSGEIRLRRLFDEKIHVFPVSGDTPVYIDMPTFMAHDITNTGQGELVTFFWSNELYNPEDTDTYPEMV